MYYVELVAIIAIIQFLMFGALTANARRIYDVKAPAISGHQEFERIYRVQINTLEFLMAFLPALFLSAKYWPSAFIAGLGIIYLVGRLIYWRSYVSDPSRRGLGFLLTLLPTLCLVFTAFAGVCLTIIGIKVF
ncbi:MAG: MAPEG family protein [Burkholderiaceae bacterium]|jgi:uncharacterized MAPEG superfamily protein|nr:MAPEG family protein [Burkholderiaceae bacterium]